MKIYGNITLSEGSDLNNLTVAHGVAFPTNPNVGELFYHDSFGFVYHDGVKWNPLSTDIHTFNDSFSLVMIKASIVNQNGEKVSRASIQAGVI